MTPRRRLAIDLGLIAVVAVTAYVVSYRALVADFRVAYAIEDLLVPCTGTPGWMPNPGVLYEMPQWKAFVNREIEYFPCDAIAGMPLMPTLMTWELQKYFHLALATWFRFLGPTIHGFISFQAASYALTSIAAFLIFRLGLGRLVSLACAAGFIWSASHLSIVDLPIEYAKAPWVLGVVLLCGVLLKRDGAGKSLTWASLGLGLVAGLGIGFKPDVLAVMPLALIAPILFVRSAPPGGWMRKATATLLVVTGLAIGGGAMFQRNFFSEHGSLLPVQVLGGQDWETESFHAASPLYDYGLTYNDSHITWLINSYGHRVLGTTTVVGFFSHEMQRIATQLVLDLWATFPGDLILRVTSATLRVLQLNGQSLVITLAGVFLVFARSRREGWFLAFTIVYLCAYVSLVFQRRHFFHLEFISWFVAGVVAQAVLHGVGAGLRAWRAQRLPALLVEARSAFTRPAIIAAACVASIIAGAAVTLWGARQYQQAGMVRLVEQYQAMPREPRTIAVEPEAGNLARLRVAGLSLNERNEGAEASTADYLVIEVRCASTDAVAIRSRYLPPVVDWSNWNRDFKLPCASAGTASTLMLPIYQYAGGYRFDGLVLTAADAATVVAVSTMRADKSVRTWLDLLIPADWRSRDWFERMKDPLVTPL